MPQSANERRKNRTLQKKHPLQCRKPAALGIPASALERRKSGLRFVLDGDELKLIVDRDR